MKIAVMTIHNALNYGAVFQAYATQEILSKYGKVEIINYQNKHIEKVYKTFNIRLNHNMPKDVVRDLYLLKSKLLKKSKFNEFFKNKFILTKATDFIDSSLDTYDVYVSGSDQIWNPRITNGVDALNKDYFLSFVPDNSIKISYASSLGNYRFNLVQEKEVKELLERFDFLSVREKDGAEYLENILGKEVNQVLDPTLLLSKDEWIKKLKLKEENSNEEYILVYTVPRSELLKDVISFYAKKGIKIISVDPSIRSTGKVDKQIRDAGPEEFLNLLLNAKMVITDSFHGVCFSINFKKDFLAVSSGALSNRMKNILNLVSMEDRLILSMNEIDKINSINGDKFNEAHKLLEQCKSYSLSYLDKVFENCQQQ